MLNIDTLKSNIKKEVTEKLQLINDIISVTFVGSFETATDISLISDIDIIVIVKKLTKTVYDRIEHAIIEISANDLGLLNYDIKLNLSFGPLKFNNDSTVVFHVMIYDLEGHRKHVLESPFTCLDWEYFPATFGYNLTDIYSAFGLQLSDLFNSRRGFQAYLDDIRNSTITYRQYEFNEENVIEVKKTFSMDDRHKIEYAFHVVKFMLLNLLKILHQNNLILTVNEISDSFSLLSEDFELHSKFLMELYHWKYKKDVEPQNILVRLELFFSDLEQWMSKIELKKITLIRHGKTLLNDGTFLGKKRNPGIIKNVFLHDKRQYQQIFTSSLLRAKETGLLLHSDEYIETTELDEIDYGLAEGLNFDELQNQFPAIVKDWKNGMDPKFPEGESQSDVAERVHLFFNNPAFKNEIAIVTHNVVLRTILGKTFHFPIKDWFKLNPNHFEPHEYYNYNHVLIPNLTKEQQTFYKDAKSELPIKNTVTYGIFLIPDLNTENFVLNWKNKVAIFESNAFYLNHPVHSTVFLFNALKGDESKIKNTIIPTLNNSFDSEWLVFKNDMITGGDTLTIGIKKTNELIDFQKSVAQLFVNFRVNDIHYLNEWKDEFKDSFKKYGFPFVGNHWMPHITVASLKASNDLLTEIQHPDNKTPEQISFKISLFEISDYAHVKLHTWN